MADQMFAVFILYLSVVICDAFPKNLAWNGGPSHLKCEHGSTFWTRNGQYVKENIIAIKALTYMDDIYVITPRMKHGVISTVWSLGRERQGVELEPFPELQAHSIGDCNVIQNAVDFYLDHLGNLWVLDTGIVDTLENPQCTCPPKVIVINILLGKITKRFDVSTVSEPGSLLQNIIIEYGHLGKIFIYVSDASRGAVLVYEVSSESGWSVVACAPSIGLQIAMIKRGLTHILILVKLQQQGLFELDTAALRRRNSISPLRVFGEHAKAVLLLGSDAHHIYLRHVDCSDVLSWNTKYSYNASRLKNIHSSGPRLTPTSVAADPIKPIVLVLDSNYIDTVRGNLPTYHKITFIGQ